MPMSSKEMRLVYAIGLSLSFMTVEVIGGWLANSIAIYSDAAHLLSDIAGFGIALVAVTAARSPGNQFLTFGLVRVEIFGALLSVFSLWIISVVLLWAAYDRAMKWFEGNPEPINGKMMLGVALFGVFVNICLGYVFQEEHGHSLAHDHSHGHAHGHAHGHDHGSSCSSNSHAAKHDDHDHDCEHGGHDHGHGHAHSAPLNERSSLLANKGSKGANNNSNKNSTNSHNGQKYTILDAEEDEDDHDHDGHDHGHDHAHSSNNSHDHHDHSQCSGHDHSHASYHNSDSNNNEDDHHRAPSSSPSKKTAGVVDANLEAAQLHVLADLAQSIGVALAALVIILKPDWQIVDPMCTLLATVFGLYSTLPLIGRGFMILLEGVPSHLDWQEVLRRLEAIPGVDDVHDLHIWSLSSDTASLSVHLRATHPREALRAAHAICQELDIAHATIQVHDAADEEFCHAESCKTSSSLPPHAQRNTTKIANTNTTTKNNGSSTSSSGVVSPVHKHSDGHDHDHDHDHGHDHSHTDSNSNDTKSAGIAMVESGKQKNNSKKHNKHNSNGADKV